MQGSLCAPLLVLLCIVALLADRSGSMFAYLRIIADPCNSSRNTKKHPDLGTFGFMLIKEGFRVIWYLVSFHVGQHTGRKQWTSVYDTRHGGFVQFKDREGTDLIRLVFVRKILALKDICTLSRILLSDWLMYSLFISIVRSESAFSVKTKQWQTSSTIEFYVIFAMFQ